MAKREIIELRVVVVVFFFNKSVPKSRTIQKRRDKGRL